MTTWRVVDASGDTVISAKTIAWTAKERRTTPQAVATKEAKLMTNEIDGIFEASNAAESHYEGAI